jgi:integrase
MARPHTSEQHPGVSAYKDRNGETRYRFRMKGSASKTLTGKPGDEIFEIEYARAYAAAMRAPAVVHELPTSGLPKSWGAGFRALKETLEWSGYDHKTQSYNTRLIERFLMTNYTDDAADELFWRDVPVEVTEPKTMRLFIEGIAKTNPPTAKHMLNAVRKIIDVAIIEEWIEPEQNPTLAIKTPKVKKSTKNPAWSKPAREQFEAFHPLGSPARTCYSLALWMGNRRGDVATIAWSDIETVLVDLDGEEIEVQAFNFRQGKNANLHGGREIFMPIVDKLFEALNALEPKDNGPVLRNMYGNPFSEKALTTRMRDWTTQAGLAPGHTLHGLRRSFGTYLAECDLQARAIMDAMGHTSMAVADDYVRDANKKRAMVDAARRINVRAEKEDAAKRRGTIGKLKLVAGGRA